MRLQWRKLLAEGISQKISTPLVSKPQIPALAWELCWMCKKKKQGVEDEKREENSGLPYKLNADCAYMIFMSQMEKGKRWKIERNKHLRVGWASCFIWPIEAQHHYSPVIIQESRVWEKKTRPFLPLFLPSSLSLKISHPLCPTLHLSYFLFLIVSFHCPCICLSLVCPPPSSVSPQGIFKSVAIHLQAPRTPKCCIEDYFSLSRG